MNVAYPHLKRPTGQLALLIGFVVVLLATLGIGIPQPVAIALVIVPAGVVSLFAPRWAYAHGILFNHPAALSGGVATLIIFICSLFNYTVTVEAATAFVSLSIFIVSLMTPRLNLPDTPSIPEHRGITDTFAE